MGTEAVSLVDFTEIVTLKRNVGMKRRGLTKVIF